MGEQQTDGIVAAQQPPAPQQPTDDEPFFPDSKLGDAWGDAITNNRAAELEAMLLAWEAEKEHDGRKGPFVAVTLNGADVFWLAARTLAGSGESQAIASATAMIHRQLDIEMDLDTLSLDGADLRRASLEYAFLRGAHLDGADLRGTHLKGASLNRVHLRRADLSWAHLEAASLSGAHLEGATFSWAHLEYAFLREAHLEGANLSRVHLEVTDFNSAHLQYTFFSEAHLEGADLRGAHLEGKRMPAEELTRILLWKEGFLDLPEVLPPADLRLAFFDSGSALNDVTLSTRKFGAVRLADVRWGDVNLAVVDWTRTSTGVLSLRQRLDAIALGDENEAYFAKGRDGKPKDRATRLQEYKDAVRANRQLATVLRQQGLNEDADRFAYKAQKLQRQVLRRQRRYGAAFGSWLLDIIAGHGYKPVRTLTVYLLAIITFAIAYFALGQTVGPHLSPLGAFVFSMTSFHGRGFFPGGIVLDDPITVLAAFEAFIGLVIEVSFIATFTQRFFAR